MEINDRQKKILKLVVEKYVDDRNSISSLILAKTEELSKWSSATIRNDMVVLEEKGYLRKEHFSSGKVPTKTGYRFYIESLMTKFDGDETVKNKLLDVFSRRHDSVDEILDECAEIISKFLLLPTVIVKRKHVDQELLKKIDIAYIEGDSHLIYIVTSSSEIIKELIVIQEENRADIMGAIRILNEKLFDCPINEVERKITDILPDLKKTIHAYEFLYEKIIAHMIFSRLLKRPNVTHKVYNSQLIITQPEIQRKEINLEKVFELLEETSTFDSINFNYEKTGRTLFNLDKAEGLSVVSTSIDSNSELAEHTLSVIGPVRMNYSLIKFLFDFLNEKLTS